MGLALTHLLNPVRGTRSWPSSLDAPPATPTAAANESVAPRVRQPPDRAAPPHAAPCAYLALASWYLASSVLASTKTCEAGSLYTCALATMRSMSASSFAKE